MLTNWLPWPGNRNAILPAGGPAPRKIPWLASAFHAIGASASSARRARSSLVDELARRLVEVDDDPFGRGEVAAGRAGERGHHARLHAGELAGRAAREARRRSARRGQDAAQRGPRRRRPAERRCAGRSTGDGTPAGTETVSPSASSSSMPGDVLLEHDVEVRSAEAVRADARAARSPVRASATRAARVLRVNGEAEKSMFGFGPLGVERRAAAACGAARGRP